MSDRMSLEHARTLATGYGGTTVNETRAARTIVKVGKVADLLGKMAEDNRKAAADLSWAAPGAMGRAHAYDKAAQFIREALGISE